MIPFDKILRAAWVVPMSGNPIANGWVALRDGKIAKVGSGSAPPARESIEYNNGVVLPGLINAHTHLGCSFLDMGPEGGDDNADFLTWIDQNVTPHVLEAYFGAEADSARPRVLKAAIDAANTMVSSGTTTVVDSFFDAIGFDVLSQLGLRGLFCREYFGSRSDQLPEYIASMKERTLKDVARFGRERVQFGLAPHALYSCPRDVLVEIFGVAHDRQLPLTIHVAESPSELEFFVQGHGAMKDLFAPGEKKERYDFGKSPIQMMHDLDLLRPGILLVHMVQVDEEDLDLVAESGAGIVHCPASNATLNVGLAPVRSMLKRGIPVAIGTDSLASNSSMSLFDEMRFAMSRQHTTASGPDNLGSWEVLRMATAGGAEVCGVSSTVGTLEVGKEADLLVMSPRIDGTDLPKAESLADWIIGTESQVESTFVGGSPCFARNNTDDHEDK
ncbi:MAG: cytosine/adenosine deaminase-related metal-dependent hydrolase [Planctomycetota bacterium]